MFVLIQLMCDESESSESSFYVGDDTLHLLNILT